MGTFPANHALQKSAVESHHAKIRATRAPFFAGRPGQVSTDGTHGAERYRQPHGHAIQFRLRSSVRRNCDYDSLARRIRSLRHRKRRCPASASKGVHLAQEWQDVAITKCVLDNNGNNESCRKAPLPEAGPTERYTYSMDVRAKFYWTSQCTNKSKFKKLNLKAYIVSGSHNSLATDAAAPYNRTSTEFQLLGPF